MLSIMIAENAGQQHENMASVLDAVAAVMCKLTHEVIVTGLHPGGRHRGGKGKEANLDTGPAGSILQNGVGVPSIETYTRGQIGQDVVRSAVAALKPSTQYAQLMQGVIARVLKE